MSTRQTLMKGLLTASIIILLGAGCGASTEEVPDKVSKPQTPSDWISYNSPNGWSMPYPSDWIADNNEEKDGGLMFFFAPYVDDPNEFNHNVNVGIQKVEGEILPLRQVGPAAKVGIEGKGAKNVTYEVVPHHTGEALYVTYSTIVDEEELFGFQSSVYDKNNNLVISTFTASKQGYDFFLDDVKLMMQALDQ